jgi:hypothetical protein
MSLQYRTMVAGLPRDEGFDNEEGTVWHDIPVLFASYVEEKSRSSS